MSQELLETHTDTVRDEWIDPNGHMNVTYFTRTFDLATDGLYDQLGLGYEDIERTNCSVFMLEMHVTFLQELHRGDPLRFATRLLDFDDKRLHYFHEMHQSKDGFLAATSEHIAIHVDMATRRSAPMLASTLALLGRLKTAHHAMPQPAQAGRSIGLTAGRAG